MIIRSMYFRDEDEIQFVKKLLADRRGKPVINHKPVAQPVPEQIQYANIKPKEPDLSISAVNVSKMPKLPAFLLDVMNGGTFPAQEDLTRAEQAILYDPQINKLVNLYRQTKKADLAQHIRERLDELGVDF